ncbi:MAG: glycerol-3-phosphate 1-O-acyltransferase PlsY [candidate division WOR-3 bacterium]
MMNITNILISFLIGMLFGIIPFSYLLGLIKGVDLKKTGSGNIGATNLGRSLGLTFFIIGFLLDALKGFLPVLITRSFNLYPAFAGAGAILGHIFNPIFHFKGGKGVSTTIGVALSIVPQPFLIAIGVWLIIYLSTYIVSIASISMAIILSIATFLIGKSEPSEKILIVIISILVLYAHRSNIKRLINKTESKTILWRKK